MPARFDVENVAPGTNLELYVSPTCPYCKAAREHYDRAGVAYVAHDAANDSGVRDRMLALTGGDPTVPAIVINGEYAQSGWGNPPSG